MSIIERAIEKIYSRPETSSDGAPIREGDEAGVPGPTRLEAHRPASAGRAGDPRSLRNREGGVPSSPVRGWSAPIRVGGTGQPTPAARSAEGASLATVKEPAPAASSRGAGAGERGGDGPSGDESASAPGPATGSSGTQPIVSARPHALAEAHAGELDGSAGGPESSAAADAVPAEPVAGGAGASSTNESGQTEEGGRGAAALPAKAETDKALTSPGEPSALADAVVLASPEPWPGCRSPEERTASDLDESRRAARRHVIRGLLTFVLGFIGLVLWAALAPLESASIAKGEVAPSSGRKTVQHLEGGIVKEIVVKDGARVEAGDVVVRLDDTQARSSVAQLEGRYRGLLAREGRLVSERNGEASIRFAQELLDASADPEVARLTAAQDELFKTRREAFDGQTQILNDRISQYHTQIKGLEAERKAAEEQLKFIAEELSAARKLLEKGIYEKPKVLALERNAAALRGSIGSHDANIARAKEAIGETQSRLIDLKNQRMKEIATELEQVQAQLLETGQRLGAARDVLARTEVRATVTGIVVGSMFRTVGGVIPPRVDIMHIVPENDPLIVEVHIQPTDVDVVQPGLPAEVRFPALNYRTTPIIVGTLVEVSADLVTDPTNRQSFYRGKVEVTPEALRTAGDISLYPGMPAEVYILLGERSFLDYLLKPLTDSMDRAWREE